MKLKERHIRRRCAAISSHWRKPIGVRRTRRFIEPGSGLCVTGRSRGSYGLQVLKGHATGAGSARKRIWLATAPKSVGAPPLHSDFYVIVLLMILRDSMTITL